MSIFDKDRKPGFNEVPEVDPNRPAATDGLDDVVGAIMDNLEDKTTNKTPSKHKDEPDDDTQLV